MSRWSAVCSRGVIVGVKGQAELDKRSGRSVVVGVEGGGTVAVRLNLRRHCCRS